MKYISEKTLHELKTLWKNIDANFWIGEILEQCEEINPWKDINENTPRNRLLLLKNNKGFMCVGTFQKDHLGNEFNVDQSGKMVVVDQYKEIDI